MAIFTTQPRDLTRPLRTAARRGTATFGERLDTWSDRAGGWTERARLARGGSRVDTWLRGLRQAIPLAALSAAAGDLARTLRLRRRRRWDEWLASAVAGLAAFVFGHPRRALVVGLVAGYVLSRVACRMRFGARTAALEQPHSGNGDSEHTANQTSRQRRRRAERPDIPPPSAGPTHDETKVDAMSMDSFPASDPPSTLGGITPGGGS